jgi:hypothetical protein
MMDILGKPLLDTTVTATNKLWWPHCEALYACTLAYERSGDTSWLEWLAKIDKFCYEVRSIPSWILFHRLVVRLLRSPQRLHFNCSHPFSLTRYHPPPPHTHTHAYHRRAYTRPLAPCSGCATVTTEVSGSGTSTETGLRSTSARVATTRDAFTCHALFFSPTELHVVPSTRQSRSEWHRLRERDEAVCVCCVCVCVGGGGGGLKGFKAPHTPQKKI